MTPNLKKYFDKWCRETDRSLERFLPREKNLFQTIHKAMRHSIFAGGKRLRPVLVVAGAEICGLNGKKVLPTACALEMIHTYSLIHDDLPAMDDDDLRRGRPTNHKVFGEGIAILAGDSLLTYAFDLIAKNAKILPPQTPVAEVVHVVAEGAGFNGMVGGQVVDLEMGEAHWMKKPRRQQVEILKTIHENKTSALIRTSLVAGALLARAGDAKVRRLAAYGQKIGLAFQIADDILDIVGDKKLLGKTGSDRKNKKLTYPALYGIQKSRETADRLVREAKRSLDIFGAKAALLSELADFIVQRTH